MTTATWSPAALGAALALETPSHTAARAGNAAGVSADQVNLPDSSHQTPLHLMVLAANPAGVDTLLGMAGVNVNALTTTRQTPLHLACTLADPAAATAIGLSLLGHGANASIPNIEGNPPLFVLLGQRRLCPIELFDALRVAYPDAVSHTNAVGDTALHVAARHGQVAAVPKLLTAGANPDATSNGRTPRDCAVAAKYADEWLPPDMQISARLDVVLTLLPPAPGVVTKGSLLAGT